MKKIVILFLFFMMFIPLMVNAETTFSVSTNVTVEGTDLEENQFTFVLKDNKGNIIKKAKNDANGNVVFKDILLPDSNGNDFFMYYIEEEIDDQIGYTYDDKRIYVKVPSNYSESNNQIYYYKDGSLEEKMKQEIPIYEYKEPYHATEEELKGEAYAVLDLNTETLYFRRYENLDTSSFEYPFDASYSGDKNRAVDETNGYMYLRNVEDNKMRFRSAFSYCYWIDGSYKCPRKVIFEDAFKPTFTDGTELFIDLVNYVEEIDFSHFDSSNITNMEYMFNNIKLKKLDLSMFDTSNVVNMSNMFRNSKLEELDLSSFTFESLKDMSYMFDTSKDLRVIKIPSTSKTIQVETISHLFSGCSSLELMDVSWITINKNTQVNYTFFDTKLKYLDLSHWNITQESQSHFSIVFMNSNELEYLDISNIKTPITGSYSSSDYNLNKNIKVIKTSHEFNPIYRIISGPEINNYFFNTEIMDFTDDISTNNYDNDYYVGGTYLNVRETGIVGFVNKYVSPIVEVDSVEESLENPKTGDKLFIVILLMIISLSIGVIVFNNKESKYKA